MTDITTTVALTYRRVSTDRQEREGVSLEVQSDQILSYVRRQGGWILGQDYQDVMSGRKASRPQYQAMLAEARRLAVDGHRVAVVVAALDRLGRNLLESARAREEFKEAGIALHCIREGGPLSDLHANIMASIAEDEAARIRARVIGSKGRNREHGYRTTSPAPWGFVWSKNPAAEAGAKAPKSILTPDPITAPYVAQVFCKVAGGQSVRSVARWVADLPTDARGGRVLQANNVYGVIRNPSYIARVEPPRLRGKHGAAKPAYTDGLALPRGRWESLIDDATWSDAQRQVALHQRMPKQARAEFLLTGLARCGRCGLRMQGRNQQRPGGMTRQMICSAPGRGCNFGGRADLIEQAALHQIDAVLSLVDADAELMAKIRRQYEVLTAPAPAPDARRAASFEAKITKARRRQDDVLALLVDKTITREQYQAFVERTQQEIEATQRELRGLQATKSAEALPSFKDVMKLMGGWCNTMRQGTVREQREVLAALVEQVTVHRSGRNRYSAEIAWTEVGQAISYGTQRTG